MSKITAVDIAHLLGYCRAIALDDGYFVMYYKEYPYATPKATKEMFSRLIELGFIMVDPEYGHGQWFLTKSRREIE